MIHWSSWSGYHRARWSSWSKVYQLDEAVGIKGHVVAETQAGAAVRSFIVQHIVRASPTFLLHQSINSSLHTISSEE